MKLAVRGRAPPLAAPPVNRVAKIQFGSGTLPRDCLITDISDGGVRLHVEGFDVPDDFVLLLSGDDIGAKERIYRVVWRLGYEIGAKFVGHVRRTGRPQRAKRRPGT